MSWKSGSGGHQSLTMGLGDHSYRQLFASMGNGEMGSSWKEMWVKRSFVGFPMMEEMKVQLYVNENI